ncbi:unnamed protein product [Acanthosepion pharaonis]|uniref:Uncharacterized protein n=1 Tax=Acanthosepion pharaonis TaxID=158019 RepID=A0A812CQN8_ACAPH|nr:unnamed protein product [Sepia pharaonis]
MRNAAPISCRTHFMPDPFHAGPISCRQMDAYKGFSAYSSVSCRIRSSFWILIFSLLALDSSSVLFSVLSATASHITALLAFAYSSISFCLLFSLSLSPPHTQVCSPPHITLSFYLISSLLSPASPENIFAHQPPAISLSDPETDVIAAFFFPLILISSFLQGHFPFYDLHWTKFS